MSERHIDNRNQCISNLFKGGLIKIIFVRIEDHDANIIVKIVIQETYEKYVVEVLGQFPEDCKVRDKKGVRKYLLYI